TLRQGNVEEASEMFHQVLHIAARYADPDLSAMGRLGRGQSLIMLGDVQGGIALFDENMVAVTSGEISPVLAGIIYCSVIDGCRAIFDLRRAREWTEALDEWCQSQPGLVEFRGACSVFRAQLKQLNGAWSEAAAKALRAPYPDAVAAYASGAVLLALGDTRLALESLRSAAGLWRELDAPYEGARTRLLIGMACRAMGDRDAAAMELDAARAT